MVFDVYSRLINLRSQFKEGWGQRPSNSNRSLQRQDPPMWVCVRLSGGSRWTRQLKEAQSAKLEVTLPLLQCVLSTRGGGPAGER